MRYGHLESSEISHWRLIGVRYIWLSGAAEVAGMTDLACDGCRCHLIYIACDRVAKLTRYGVSIGYLR